MDQTVLDNLKTAFEEGTTSKVISGSFSDLEDSIGQTVEACQNIDRNWSGTMWTDIVGGFATPIGELNAYGPEDVKSLVSILSDRVGDLSTEVSSISSKVASAEHPVQKVLSSSASSDLEKLKTLTNEGKILDGWNQLKDISLGMIQEQSARVESFIQQLEQFGRGPASGAYVDDILQAYNDVRSHQDTLFTELSQVIGVAKTYITGSTDNQVNLKNALAKCETLMRQTTVEEVTAESALFYGTEGLSRLASLCETNRQKILAIVDSSHLLAEWMTTWKGLWDQVIQNSAWVRASDYKIATSTRSIQGSLVDSVIQVAESLKEGSEFIKKSNLGLSGTDTININTLLSPILNWETQSGIFKAPVVSASQGRTYVDRRYILLNYLTFHCISLKEAPKTLESLLSNVEAISLDELTSEIEVLIESIQKVFSIDMTTGESSLSFSDHEKDIEGLNEAISAVGTEVAKCCKKVDEMPETTDEEKERKSKCKAACKKCQQCQEEAQQGGGGCGGNSSNANSNCNASCCNSSCAKSICNSIMSILAAAFTNFMTHGFKWHQGDVFIDGNLFVTKNVFIFKNLFVLKNLTVMKNAIINGTVASGAHYAPEFFAGYSIPLLENVNDLWAQKKDRSE